MRRIHALVGLIVAALAWTGSQPGRAAEPTPKDGGTIVMATGAQVQGFDALTIRAANRETTMAGGLIFSNFFTKNAAGDRVPDLATSFDSSPDGLTWRLKLRPDSNSPTARPTPRGTSRTISSACSIPQRTRPSPPRSAR